MKIFSLILSLAFTVALAHGAARPLSDDDLLQIKFDQKLNAQLSGALAFRDETGKTVTLGNYFGQRPVVLMLGYYGCPMLCTLALNGAVSTFQDLKWTAGEQFEVIFVSIDPSETPALAAAKKKTYLRSYGRGPATGWHFLTGNSQSINALANSVGFHFAYDPVMKQFAHPSGLVILTPDGKVSHYLFGVTYSAAELNADLHDATARKTGSPVEQFVLLCFHYSPLTGKYGNTVMAIVRGSGIVMMAGLGVMIWRKPRAKPGRPAK
jgi:protein SCO1/2